MATWRFPRRSLTLLCCTAVTVALLPATTQASSRGEGTVVRPRHFGMHVADPGRWPSVPVGSIRLWDSGTTWRDLEPRAGVFSFQRLDSYVAEARSQGTKVMLVLGQTPAFHVSAAARPAGSVEYHGTGASRMPRRAAWRHYVRTVATRYAGRIEALQVWNEANIVGFWSGTPRQMARLTYWTSREVDRVNRRLGSRIRLVSPSFVARTNTAPMDRYWRQSVAGRRMNSLVDRVALSLYPPAGQGPEQAVSRLVRLRRTILSARRVTKPIWNTEINYGLALGGASDPVQELDRERQAAYVMRTYLLNAAAGVSRVYWYSWDQHGNVNTVLSVAGRPTLAGHAYRRVQRWMTGSRVRACHRTTYRHAGTYVCSLEDRRGLKRVYWNPTRTVRLRPGDRAVWSRDLHGSRTRLRPGDALVVDFRPVLVRLRTGPTGS